VLALDSTTLMNIRRTPYRAGGPHPCPPDGRRMANALKCGVCGVRVRLNTGVLCPVCPSCHAALWSELYEHGGSERLPGFCTGCGRQIGHRRRACNDCRPTSPVGYCRECGVLISADRRIEDPFRCDRCFVRFAIGCVYPGDTQFPCFLDRLWFIDSEGDVEEQELAPAAPDFIARIQAGRREALSDIGYALRGVADGSTTSCSHALLTDQPLKPPNHVCIRTADDTVSRYAELLGLPSPGGVLPLPLGRHRLRAGQADSIIAGYDGPDEAWAGLVVTRAVQDGRITLFGLVKPPRGFPSVRSHAPSTIGDPCNDALLDMWDDPLNKRWEPDHYSFTDPYVLATGRGLGKVADELEHWYQDTLLGQRIVRIGRPPLADQRDWHREQMWNALHKLRNEGTRWTVEEVAQQLGLGHSKTWYSRRDLGLYSPRDQWETFYSEYQRN
jgi:hypothetical protein